MLRYIILFITLIIFISCNKSDNSSQPTTPSDKGSVSGRVFLAKTGVPVPLVLISTNPSTSSVFSDTAGRFKIDNMPPADYKLIAYKIGYDSAQVQVKVIAGINSTADISIFLTDSTKFLKYGSISGKVLDVLTYNPIANVSISTSPASGTVLSDINGNYEINDVTPGLVTVYAYKTNYDSTILKVTVNKGVVTPANILLKQKDTTKPSTTGTITGTVYDAATKQPINKALVVTDPATSSVTTDINGKFTISNINPGNYKVTASRQGYTNSIVNVNVTAGKTSNADINLMPEFGAIQGVIYDAANGQKIAGVFLRTNPISSTITSDLGGQYMFDRLTAGNYSVIAQKAGYYNDTVNVKVTAGNTTNADFYMRKSP